MAFKGLDAKSGRQAESSVYCKVIWNYIRPASNYLQPSDQKYEYINDAAEQNLKPYVNISATKIIPSHFAQAIILAYKIV
jgi:hypothetical protein